MTMTFTQGTFYHVKWKFPVGNHGGDFIGQYVGKDTDERGGTYDRFWQPAWGRFTGLKFGKQVVEATPLDEAVMMALLDLYARVHIHKYGSTYTGTVVGKKRTRVCVAFRTNGGQDKEQWFRVLDVEPLTKPATA
jgi:hypothetical protein